MLTQPKLSHALLISCLALASTHANANVQGHTHTSAAYPHGAYTSSNTRMFLSVNYDTGGQGLAGFDYTDGSSTTIEANQGASINLGAEQSLGQGLSARVTVGYKLTSVDAFNGQATFSQVPVEFLLLYRVGQLHIGAGASYQADPTLECVVDRVCNERIEFENSLGTVVQVGYQPPIFSHTQMLWSLRYTQRELNLAEGDDSFDASGLGISVGYLF